MISIALTVTGLVLVLGATVVGVFAALRALTPRTDPAPDLVRRVTEIEAKMQGFGITLETALNEVITYAESARKEHAKARAAESRAKRHADPEDDEEELLPGDASGGRTSGVQPVPETVAGAPTDAWPWPPGMSPYELNGMM